MSNDMGSRRAGWSRLVVAAALGATTLVAGGGLVGVASADADSADPVAAQVTLHSSPNPSNYGDTVTLTATIDADPHCAVGDVYFQDGVKQIGAGKAVPRTDGVSGSTASFSTATLTAGTHSLTVVFGPVENDCGEPESHLDQVVGTATHTFLRSSPNPSNYGDSVELTMTASTPPPCGAGEVEFRDGATVIGTRDFVPRGDGYPGGGAILDTATLSAGTHSLTARFLPQSPACATSQATLDQVVNGVVTHTVLGSNNNPSDAGQLVTFRIAVGGGGADECLPGEVEVKDGSTSLGTVATTPRTDAVNSANAEFTTPSALSPGSHTITATFSPTDADECAPSSATLTQTVAQRPAIVFYGQPSGNVYGQGSVFRGSFKDPGCDHGAFTLRAGDVTLPVDVSYSIFEGALSLGVGTYTVTAGYTPDPVSDPSYCVAGSVSLNYEVTPARLVITASDVSSQYGHPAPAIAPGYEGFVLGEGPAVLSAAPTCSAPVDPATVPGTYQSTCSGAAAANYTISYAAGTATVSKAPLKVVPLHAKMTYGDATPAIGPNYSGFVRGDGPAALDSLPTCSTSAGPTSPVGSYPSTCSGGSSKLYDLTYADGEVPVTKAPLTVTAADATITYGDAAPHITATYTGFVNGEGPAVLDTAPTCTTSAGPTTPVGRYDSSCSGGADDNYSFTDVNGAVTVAAAQLTVNPDDATRVYGANNPAFGYHVTGFVNGQGPSVLSGRPDLASPATSSSHPGTYPITSSLGTLVSPNYRFTFGTGTLTVTKAPLRVTPARVSVVGSLLALKTTLAATVVNAQTGAPVVGLPVTFTARTLFGNSVGCTAVTNASGVAACSVAYPTISLTSGYSAAVAGNSDYLPATERGSIKLV